MDEDGREHDERARTTRSLRRTPMGSGGAAPSDGTDGPEHDEQAPAAPEPPPPPTAATDPDLERIAGDLADIERALERLDDGAYWSDEVTGEVLPDDLLAADPTARRTAYAPDPPRVAEADNPPPPAPA